ncbi:MAG: hypothetical protein QOJ15_1108 [Bradyrhizobium sp.]|jgi:hypothetical protein|nr:hypothetical protein [Bradyrhizobium sp.]
MFEIIIFCVIALAIGYWTALFLMGRRDDVLHGDFVEAEPQPEAVPTTLSPPRMGSATSLQSLLAAIKQDLKDTAQI